MPCSLIGSSQHFLYVWCLHLRGKSLHSFQSCYHEGTENPKTAFCTLYSGYSAMKQDPSLLRRQLWNIGRSVLHVSVPLAPLLCLVLFVKLVLFLLKLVLFWDHWGWHCFMIGPSLSVWTAAMFCPSLFVWSFITDSECLHCVSIWQRSTYQFIWIHLLEILL